MAQDKTHQLRSQMQQVGFSSFKSLAVAAKVSEKQLRLVRLGKVDQLRLETLLKLSRTLRLPLQELLLEFGQSSDAAISEPPTRETQTTSSKELDDLRREYDRLQQKLADQKQETWLEFQQSSLQILESLLLQLPTAAYAAQQNPQAPAVKLLPLLRPLDRLLQEWGVEQLASVGAEVAYNPQQHQLMEGTVAVGEPVRVRYTGYRQGDRLLYRARVSPIAPAGTP